MAAHLMLRQSDEIFWKNAVALNTIHAKSNPNKLSPERLWSCDVLWNNDSNLILFKCETLFEISFGHFMEMNDMMVVTKSVKLFDEWKRSAKNSLDRLKHRR